MYLSLKNNTVSYVSRLLRSREFVQRKQKWDQLLCTVIKKKSIIGTGKRSTPALALQWLFYLVLRTDQYYHNLMNFAHSKWSDVNHVNNKKLSFFVTSLVWRLRLLQKKKKNKQHNQVTREVTKKTSYCYIINVDCWFKTIKKFFFKFNALLCPISCLSLQKDRGWGVGGGLDAYEFILIFSIFSALLLDFPLHS